MNLKLNRNLFATAAASVLLAAAGMAHAGDAGEGGLTREQVKAELAEARALGTLDEVGERGATDKVLLAREMFNQTQTQVILARYDLEQRLVAEAQAAEANVTLAPEQAAYMEQGTDGPVLMLVSVDQNGEITSVDDIGTLQMVAVDID